MLTYIVVMTLALVVAAVVGVFLVGLFVPAIDNDKILAILGPAFQTTIGAFVGVLSSRISTAQKNGE